MSPRWNGAIGKKQLDWLRQILLKADLTGEKIILFCHFPVYPENAHNLWNAEEVVAVLEEHSSVLAYINGHNHVGGYAIKYGIHYLTMKGMVDTDQSAYSIFRVKDEEIHVLGFGRESDRKLKFR